MKLTMLTHRCSSLKVRTPEVRTLDPDFGTSEAVEQPHLSKKVKVSEQVQLQGAVACEVVLSCASYSLFSLLLLIVVDVFFHPPGCCSGC